MRSERIIKRQGLKQQHAELKTALRASRPFMDAQNQLRQAYQKGVQDGFKMAAEEIAKAEKEKADKTVGESGATLGEPTSEVQVFNTPRVGPPEVHNDAAVPAS